MDLELFFVSTSDYVLLSIYPRANRLSDNLSNKHEKKNNGRSQLEPPRPSPFLSLELSSHFKGTRERVKIVPENI